MTMHPDHFPPRANIVRPRLIVCERLGTWAARLRPRLPRQVALRQTRSVAESLAELEQSPASFVVLEVSPANLPNVFELLSSAQRKFPHSLMAGVAQRQHAELEWLLREAGAVHFCTSPRAVGEIAQLAIRHLERVPQPRIGLAARVWESLPWPEAAAG